MTETRLPAPGLRSLAGIVALAGLLGLSACGGGSGAPNNVFDTPGPLTVSPGIAVAYSGTPTVLTVSGGTPPYRVFSSNSALVPVTQAVSGSAVVIVPGPVSADSDVTITVQDNVGGVNTPVSTSATITVRAAPLVNSLTITPNSADCGTTAICSGQDGTAAVAVLGLQGGPLPGRQVQFDVVSGPYGIATTNPAQPVVSSLRVFSDANGAASVIIRANVNAPTQFAQLRVTDLTSGQQLTGNFLIQQLTDGSKILTVVPAEAKITGPFKGVCSSGFATDYYIYGGTPPYRITSSFPVGVTLVNSTVNVAGGFFRAITNGSCVDPLTFSILDATGRQTTSKLSNVEGSEDAPAAPPPTALAVAPAAIKEAACTGKTFKLVVYGGTPPYNVSPSNGTASPPTVPATGGSASISGLLTDSGTTAVVFLDSSSPQKSATATITCSAATTP